MLLDASNFKGAGDAFKNIGGKLGDGAKLFGKGSDAWKSAGQGGKTGLKRGVDTGKKLFNDPEVRKQAKDYMRNKVQDRMQNGGRGQPEDDEEKDEQRVEKLVGMNRDQAREKAEKYLKQNIDEFQKKVKDEVSKNVQDLFKKGTDKGGEGVKGGSDKGIEGAEEGAEGIEGAEEGAEGIEGAAEVAEGSEIAGEGAELIGEGAEIAGEGAEIAAEAGELAIEGGVAVGEVAAEVGLESAAIAGGTAVGSVAPIVGNIAGAIIGFIVAQFIMIAIHLGLKDVIDGLFELGKSILSKNLANKSRYLKKAIFLIVRACTKIALFVWFFIMCLLPFGIFIAFFLLHIYWLLSWVPGIGSLPFMQGLVWWEKLLIVWFDLEIIFIIGITIAVGLFIWCNIGSIAGRATGGSIGQDIGGVFDKVTTFGSYCAPFTIGGGATRAISTFGGGSNYLGTGGVGSAGSASGNETVGNYTAPAGNCSYSGKNLCETKVRPAIDCSRGKSFGQWEPGIAKASQLVDQNGGIPGVSTAALIKGIMANESGLNPNAQSPDNPGVGPACGLMQFIVPTARQYARYCKTDDHGNPINPAAVSCQWLKSNPNTSICMAGFYLQALSKSAPCNQPKVEVRNLAAGYNSGSGCKISAACSGETGCDGSPVKNWECVWNDKAHNSCNEAYTWKGTRDYSPSVFACYVNFK
jgi:hypothetical protein